MSLLSLTDQPFLIINKIIILTFGTLILSSQLSPLSLTLAKASTTINNPSKSKSFNPFDTYEFDGVAADTSIRDNYDYSDDEYYRYAAEYEDNLRASFAAKEEEDGERLEMERENAEQGENKVSADDENNHSNATPSLRSNHQKHGKKEEESYAEMASRLKCDNPWFWNAPRCTWIDVKARHVIGRTRKNAETSAWFLGSIIIFVSAWLCGFYCCYQIKQKHRLKMLKIRERYAPGRIELPNGKIAHFQPTEEENKAYEELVKAVIIQDMSLMV